MKNWKLSGFVLCSLVIGICYFNSSAFGQAKPIELSYSLHHPAQDSLTVLVKEWGKEVEKRTNGRVTITVFPGGTLLPADKCYDGVLKGIADMGLAVPANTRGRFPLTPDRASPDAAHRRPVARSATKGTGSRTAAVGWMRKASGPRT
jgi:TRAP-type C4-dicarboxylate transport system substrate-binding protein